MGGVQGDEHDRRGPISPTMIGLDPQSVREHERDQDEAGKAQTDQCGEAAPAGDHNHDKSENQRHDQQWRTPLEVRELVLGRLVSGGGTRTNLMTWPTLTPDE